jgi:hypothetical protein
MADTLSRGRTRKRSVLSLPFASLVFLAGSAAVFVSYVLWPTWPGEPPATLDVPEIPITVAGVLFEVPPAAIRESVQRHAGDQDRIDLAFAWPSLAPPRADDKPAAKTNLSAENAAAAAAQPENERLFVTIDPGSAPSCRRSIGCGPSIRAMSNPARARARTGWPFCRSAPARPMRAKIWFMSAAIPSSFSPFARVPAIQCRAPAFRNGCSEAPRSPSASRAPGLAIGKPSPPALTSSSRNCTRSEIDRPAGRRGFRLNPYPGSAFQEYRRRAAFHRRQTRRR